MGNRRAREFQLEQDRLARLAEQERAKTQPRLANHSHLRGPGILRLQLIVLPSFTEPRAWEVRQVPHLWRLCSSRTVEPAPDTLLVGFDPLSFDSNQLHEFYRRLTALTLPLGPRLDGFAGADGSLYQLAVYGDSYSHFRFQWWSVHPPQWQSMVNIVSEMIQAFLMAEGRSADECEDWLE